LNQEKELLSYGVASLVFWYYIRSETVARVFPHVCYLLGLATRRSLGDLLTAGVCIITKQQGNNAHWIGETNDLF
jgi:hypothetical protein